MKTTTYTIKYYSVGTRTGNVLYHLIKDEGTVAHKSLFTGEKASVESILKEILATETEVVVITRDIETKSSDIYRKHFNWV